MQYFNPQRQIQLTFASLEKCPLCLSEFSRLPQRLPRVLFCGHSICSQCVKNEILRAKSLICPSCKQVFSKQACSQFEINYLYLDMVDWMQQSYGHVLLNLPQCEQVYSSLNNNQSLVNQNYQQVCNQEQKCKNSLCYNFTQFMFCSQQCRFQYDQVSTNKENYYQQQFDGNV